MSLRIYIAEREKRAVKGKSIEVSMSAIILEGEGGDFFSG